MNRKMLTVTLFHIIILALTYNAYAAASTIDDFSGYTSTTSLKSTWQWTGVVSGNSMAIALSTSGGTGGSKAMQVDFSFSSGQTNPKGYTGRSLNSGNAVDWSGYDGLSVWLKGSESGNTPQYVQLALHEGNGGSGNWGDKMESAKVYINNLNSAGEYVFLAFTDFTDYGGFGGARDNGVLQLDDIRSVFVFSKYDGTPNQTSSASFLADDIVVKTTSVLPLIRNPYLQNVTQTGVKVMWGSNESTGKVYWGSTVGTYTNSASSAAFLDNSGVYVHTAVISGLTAGEKVYYYVQDGSNGNFGFNDATYYAVAIPAGNADFRFTFYSDSHAYNTTQGDVINTMLTHNPDIALHGGDKVTTGSKISEFNDYFFSYGAPLLKNTPSFHTVGNHDMTYPESGNGYEADIENYRALFDMPTNSVNNTDDYYSFDYGDVHFVSLNTQRVQPGGYQSGYYNETYNDAMLAWLENDLQSTNKTWKVVYFHKPIFMDWFEPQGWDIILENNGVQLVLNGHLHYYYAHNRNAVNYMIAAGGGAGIGAINWWEWHNYYIGAFRDHHFAQVDVTSSVLNVKMYDDNNVLRHWIDLSPSGGATYPPIEEVDDFEAYSDDTGLQGAWWAGDSNGISMQRYLDTGSASGSSNVLRAEFSFASGSSNPYGYTGLDGLWDWVNYTDVKLWVKASQSGPSHDFQIRLIEGSSGDKWIYSVPISSLNANGGYISVPLSDFVWYADNGSGNGAKDWDRIIVVLVGAGLSGTASASGTSSIMVDDITGYVNTGPILTDIDKFESYTSTTSLKSTWEWTGVISGNSTAIALSTSGGVSGSKAMQVDFGFSSGQTNPKGYTGRSLNNYNAVDWSGYDGLRVWLKGSESGNTPQYIQLALHEGNGGSGNFGDKMESAKVYINNLNSAGEYVSLAFADFTDYGGFGGARDNGVLQLDDIRSIFVFSKYDGTPNQTSSASFLVDDIQNYKNNPKIAIPEVDSQVSLYPEKFALYQNYPNPFNPVTTIQYDIPKTANVQLIIYDVLGREITSLVNSRLDAGYHKVQWNGRDKFGERVSSGVYVYLLKAGDYVTSKKLLLLK